MIQKLTLLILAVFLCVGLISCERGKESLPDGSSVPQESLPPGEEHLIPPVPSEFSMKGVWLSQFDLAEVYLKGDKQRPQADFEQRMEDILRGVVEMGFDTVVVQVHPYGDSFYPSAFFPPSRYITGAYGREARYDPFAVVALLCEKLSLSLHAWINPMRLMRPQELLCLDPSHPLRRCYEEQTGEVTLWEGRCYFDPSYERVREWIASAARELCEGYAIQGVHIDDYFYPTTDESFDQKGYEAYRSRGGRLPLGEFRKESVSQMVALLYRTVKEADPSKLFGISPAGNVAYVTEQLYADVERWCGQEGFADYVCPQLYYGFEHEKCPFEQSVRKWYGLCRTGKVKLVIGLTLTKASLAEDPYAGTGRYEWAGRDDIVKRSAQFVSQEGYCHGICVFSYSYLRDPLSGTIAQVARAEAENLLSVLPSLSFGKGVRR